jgi:EmrB/QacA subfamily drug resistance transporter
MVANQNDRRKWWILAAMGGVTGMLLLDETVVAVALPTMRTDLAMSATVAHWVINAYLLVFAGMTAFCGKLGDLLGHRTMFLVGLVIFGAASAACGFVSEATPLIWARAIQGVGAAIIFPVSLAMVSMVFPPEERGAAMGICGAAGTTLLALGPLVGGFLVHVLSWRWIFWINLPAVVAIAVALVAAWTEPAHERRDARIDFVGGVLLIAALSGIIFALMQGSEWGWTQPIILIPMIGGVILLALFAWVEGRIGAPLLDVKLLRDPNVAAGNLILFTAQFNQMAVVVFGSLYLQKVLEMTPLVAGLALLPAVGAAPIAGAPTGRLTDRFGARSITLWGLVVTIVGLFWISLAVKWKMYGLLVPAFLAWGTADCALYIAPRKAVMNAAPLEKQGETSGVLMTSQLLGGAVGVAVGSILFAATNSFVAVFLGPAVLSVVGLVVVWLWLERGVRPNQSLN